MKKTMAIILMIILVGALFTGCKKSDTAVNSLEQIKKDGVIKMGLDDSFPPMEFRDEKNNLVGFDIDLGNEIAKKLGVKAEFVTNDFSGIILAMQAGKFNIALTTLSITDERKKTIDFSKPYIMEGQIVVVKNDNTQIKEPSDLEGKTAACQLGSTSEQAVQSVKGLKELKKYDKIPQAFQDLSIGRIDAVVVDEIVGLYYMTQKPNEYKVLEKKLSDEPVGIGFKKEDKDLQAEIQKALDELKEDGTLSKLSVKWFGTDLYSK